MWDFAGRRLAHDLCPAAFTDQFWIRTQTLRSALPQAVIQNLFDAIPHRVAILFATRSGYNKY